MEKSSDVAYCTENLCCPRTSSRTVGLLYGVRFLLIRATSCPCYCLPSSFPIIGGRSLLDCLFITACVSIALYLCATGGEKRSGNIAEYVMILAIVLALRNNILTVMLSISFERAIYFHKLMGVLALVTGSLHGIICIYDNNNGYFMTGWVLLVLSFAASFAYMLKKVLYEYFYMAHITLYILTIPFSIMHGAPILASIVFLWVIDLVIRYVVTGRSFQAKAELIGGNVVRIIIPEKAFQYHSGQYCFLKVPAVSSYEYHPFSIFTAPHEQQIQFNIRSRGDWTDKLKALVDCELAVREAFNSCTQVPLTISVEGPYGIPSIDLESPLYEVIVLVGGGIGVTPIQSIFCHLFNQYTNNKRKIARVFFIWSVKDSSMARSMEVGMTWEKRHQGKVRQKLIDMISSKAVSHRSSIITVMSDDSSCMDTAYKNSDVVSPSSLKEVEIQPVEACQQPSDIEKASTKHNENDDVFQCEFYATDVCDDKNIIKTIVEQPYVQFGRPDLKKKFIDVADYCKVHGHKRVATVVCGPPAMTEEVSSLTAMRFNDVKFDLHKEVFSF